MIEFERKRKRRVDVELTPLIDVVFQLLVFFLLTSSLMTHAIPIEVPDAETAESSDATVVISVDRAGQVYFDDRPVTQPQLRALVHTARQEHGELQTVVAADRRALHAHFIEVLDLLRQEGVTRFGIRVEAREGEAAVQAEQP